jgi:gamma-tubulin complex component 3
LPYSWNQSGTTRSFKFNTSDSLDRPANLLYRHNLTATLESAIRGSNAQFESPDILRRLDARMLELSQGEIGWDVFTLEYKVDAPLDVIVNPYCARQYLKVFNFLWRVKRVEFAITGAWKRCATGARGVLAGVDDVVGRDWKRVRGGCGEMIHFLCQLQYYILFEVDLLFVWLMCRLLNHLGILLYWLFRNQIVLLTH